MLPLARISAFLSLMLLMAMSSVAAIAQDDDPKLASSPLRLSYVEGDVSFFRDGAEDWVEARYNTPLAAGDALYVGRDGDLELQMGSRAFIRADDDTQLTLMNQTADFIQFKVASGRVSFDLRTLPAGYTVEVDTPNAVFTIDRSGYYRVDVNGDVHFITRRGGRAMMVPAGGQAMSIQPSEEIVVRNGAVARAETYVAPELDRWDRWNYERTDNLLDAVSERYLPSGIAGASDLDHYGRWRVVGEYGPVWVPDACRRGGRPTAPADGCGTRTTSGPGLTMRRGAGRPTTMGAGFSWVATGAGRLALQSGLRSMRPRWWRFSGSAPMSRLASGLALQGLAGWR